jgi:hypothetical protein
MKESANGFIFALPKRSESETNCEGIIHLIHGVLRITTQVILLPFRFSLRAAFMSSPAKSLEFLGR